MCKVKKRPTYMLVLTSKSLLEWYILQNITLCIYFFLTYSLCSKGICQVLQLRLSKARIYSIVSQRYNRLHNHCTQVIRKKKSSVFAFLLFLKIQLEKMNTKHLRCKKCHVWAKTVRKPDENRRQKKRKERKTLKLAQSSWLCSVWQRRIKDRCQDVLYWEGTKIDFFFFF